MVENTTTVDSQLGYDLFYVFLIKLKNGTRTINVRILAIKGGDKPAGGVIPAAVGQSEKKPMEGIELPWSLITESFELARAQGP